MPPGHAVGHEGVAEVVAVGDAVSDVRVGDRVVVPFQISCGHCRECRRGATGSCGSLPLMAMYGMAPLAGLDGGGFMADLVLVPYADAMLIPIPEAVDPVAVASLSDNIPDGWRAVGPFRYELAELTDSDRRVLVVGRLSIGVYAAALAAAMGAHVDYVDTDANRLAAAEKLGAVAHDLAKPARSWDPYPVTVHTSGDPAVLSATLRATWRSRSFWRRCIVGLSHSPWPVIRQSFSIPEDQSRNHQTRFRGSANFGWIRRGPAH